MNKSCTIIATLIQFAEIIQSIISLIGKMLVLWWQSNFLFLQVAPTGTDTSYALSPRRKQSMDLAQFYLQLKKSQNRHMNWDEDINIHTRGSYHGAW